MQYETEKNILEIRDGVLYKANLPDDVVHVMIPDGVHTIEKEAFKNCKQLKGVTFPGSLKIIGDEAFEYCGSLMDLDLPDGIISLGKSCFSHCIRLRSVNIPGGLKELPKFCFFRCDELQEIEIPAAIIKIGGDAFGSCGQMKKAAFAPGSKLKEIEWGAFGWCESLEKIKLPEGLQKIGDGAFSHCLSLKTISIPETVKEIGEGAFYWCCEMKEITIPEKVTRIRDCTFTDCLKLKKINLPETITRIDEMAFEGCEALMKFSLPESVKKLGDYAFSCCMNLKTLHLPEKLESIGRGAFSRCPKLKRINLPEKLGCIRAHTFFRCLELEKITIPETVTSIGKEAFAACAKLTKVIKSDKTEMKIDKRAFIGSKWACESVSFDASVHAPIIWHIAHERTARERGVDYAAAAALLPEGAVLPDAQTAHDELGKRLKNIEKLSRNDQNNVSFLVENLIDYEWQDQLIEHFDDEELAILCALLREEAAPASKAICFNPQLSVDLTGHAGAVRAKLVDYLCSGERLEYDEIIEAIGCDPLENADGNTDDSTAGEMERMLKEIKKLPAFKQRFLEFFVKRTVCEHDDEAKLILDPLTVDEIRYILNSMKE